VTEIFTYLKSLFAFNDEHPLLFTQIHFWVIFFIIYLFFFLIVRSQGKDADGKPTLSPKKRVFRNGYLFLFSLVFYYKTSGLFVLLLIFSTLLGWRLGISMDKTLSQVKRKGLMILGVSINLFILCYFKYAYFFTDIYNATFHTDIEVVNHLALWTNNIFHTDHFDASVILLPVGISFFTFQNISYIVDVYKRKLGHVSNILDFGFYTAFFPQLVAGPILRADQFIPQLYKPFFLGRRQFGVAIFWICNGLIKKLILSDYLAVNFADRVFDNPLLYTPFENFSALMIYSLQVYADFSGYTDIAIGVAMLMGFYLPRNFNSPYKAKNPTDFWRRWHMSLSRWLRDYLYIPLGGNRTSGFASYFILAAILLIAAFRLQNLTFTLIVVTLLATILLMRFFWRSKRKDIGTNVNNMDTMLLGGLWHGSSFNFITWGGLNGLGILVYKWWKNRTWVTRLLTLLVLTVALYYASSTTNKPLFNLLWYCSIILFVGFTILFILCCIPKLASIEKKLSLGWSVLITFIFISFTRLFFRSGSNLNPAEANEYAWNIASSMVNQIGSRWNLQQIPEIVSHYSTVFILFGLGMVIHWLPARFKRRYRLWFSTMPLWLMAAFLVLMAVVLYQFVTADLQPFIYFQF
jgi:D-alanyl-lipoteichoic acid acyltransferase DltB (MBOAT superfamily)